MKKRMALPTDNPSENELVPQSMLPDTPGYPAGYVPQSDAEIQASTERARAKQKMQEENTEQAVSDNSLIAATAGFLTNTSNRFLYGERK